MADPPALKITVLGKDAIVAKLQRALGPALGERLRQGIERITIDLVGYVKTQKLSGQVLKTRTGNLRRSITQRVQVNDDGSVSGFVGIFQGPTLVYGRAHEYGFKGTITRTQTMAWGRPITPRLVKVNMNLPQRSFLRSSLKDNAGDIRARLQAVVVTALKG